jgi:hypothetical protein
MFSYWVWVQLKVLQILVLSGPCRAQRGVKPWTFGMLMDAKAVEDLKIKILEICIFRIFPNRFIMFYPSLPCFCVLKSRVMSLPL